jgi:hypothetical protein
MSIKYTSTNVNKWGLVQSAINENETQFTTSKNYNKKVNHISCVVVLVGLVLVGLVVAFIFTIA